MEYPTEALNREVQSAMPLRGEGRKATTAIGARLREAGPAPPFPRLARAAKGEGDEREMLTQLLALHHAEPIARQFSGELLHLFGTLDAVLHASREELALVPGLPERTALLLTYQRRMSELLARSRRSAGRSFTRLSAVIAHLTPSMAELPIETVRVLFLNPRNQLIVEEELSRGTVNHVTLYPRELVRRALLRGATAVVLAHNHPSGDPSPSAEDIAMTAQVEAALAAVEIALHDHLVIARRGAFSFRSNGLLPHCPSGWDGNAEDPLRPAGLEPATKPL